jgi:hypothetical protein
MINITFKTKKDLSKAEKLLSYNNIYYQLTNNYNCISIYYDDFTIIKKVLSENDIDIYYDKQKLFLKLLKNKLFIDIISLLKNNSFPYGDVEKSLIKACDKYDFISVNFVLSLDPDFCTHDALNFVCGREGDYDDIAKLLLDYETTKKKVEKILSEIKKKSLIIELIPRCELLKCITRRNQALENACKRDNLKIAKLLIDYNYFDPENIEKCIELADYNNYPELVEYLQNKKEN